MTAPAERGPRWYRRLLAGVTVEEVQRFDAAIDTVTTELARITATADDTCPWDADLDNARRHRAVYHLEAAWTALKSAKRARIGRFSPQEVVAEAHAARREATGKLSGWRQEAVVDVLPDELLLGAPDAAGIDDLRDRVRVARQVLDDRSDNVHHEFRLLRRAVISTSIVMAAALIGLIVVVAFELVPDEVLTAESPLGSWRLLVAVMVLGAVGAFLSSATELRRNDGERRIPELRVGYTLMGMRPIVGAAGAVAVIVVLQSALGEAVELQPTAVLGVAIAAGFTERLVTRTVTAASEAVGR